jgi:asparagine synthase (glutamine-hydrolysing)
MCGIAGILHLDGAPADGEILQRMTRILAHRGPDGQAEYVSGPVGLGHRRLSIIDLSNNGTQPMPNEDGSIQLTFNGEIFNYRALCSELVDKGHAFRSRTDTETIVHGYEEFGVRVVDRLNGMFAFGMWDAREQSLWLVRDRLGVKPLFYAVFDDVLLFGSEIKAILEHPAARREIEPAALDLFLSLNYTPAPLTMFKGIHQLEPGQWLIAKVGSRELTIQSYWDVDYSQQSNLSESDAVACLDELLRGAVERRLMADVPLGAFLSGGIDSSAVVAMMKSLSDQVKTFTIGFKEDSFNEAPYARQIATHLGTQHHERIVTPDLASILPKIVWHGEDPLADSSMIPVYYLSKMTREHVTVALAGDGADEILAGYPTYSATAWASRFEGAAGALLRKGAQPLLAMLPPSEEKMTWREKLARFQQGLGLPWQHAHAVWRQIHTEEQKRRVLAPGIINGHNRLFETYDRYYEKSRSTDMLDQLLYVDTRFYLPNDMLVKVDRMTMAHGLEARVPFLDYTVVEFAASLPSEYKLRGGTGKYLLRKLMADRLPETTLKRRKEGFNIPVSRWLRGELRELLQDTLTPIRLREVGLWQSEPIVQMVQDHQARKADYGHQLWGMLTFMLWWDQFMGMRV